MIRKLDFIKARILFAGLCITAILGVGILTLAAASEDTSGQDRTFCVRTGYLYRTSPSLNGGQPICQFADNSWCDAHDFATGQCFPGRFHPSNPYFFNAAQSTQDVFAASSACRNSGGRVENVHTPYGDVDLCVFPDGSSVDLRALYFGAYDGAYNRALSDDWFYYAYSWLNAP